MCPLVKRILSSQVSLAFCWHWLVAIGGPGWVFIYPSGKNQCFSPAWEVCGSIEGFKNASLQNRWLLHAIDGCLAGEESKWQRTHVYWRYYCLPLLSSSCKKAIMFPLPCLFVGLSSCCLLKLCTIKLHLIYGGYCSGNVLTTLTLVNFLRDIFLSTNPLHLLAGKCIVNSSDSRCKMHKRTLECMF